MIRWRRHELPLDAPFLPGLARLLLEVCGYDLPSALVVLPAVRACGSLRHALLEESGRAGLLLPRLVTPGQLVADLAGRLDLDAAPTVTRRLRPAALAPHLAATSWVRERPGAAAGLAEELVRLFDELRRHGLDPAAVAAEDGDEPGGEIMTRDAARVAEAWRLHRAAAPRDDIDREREVVAALEDGPWPGPPVVDLVVAGVSDLAPLTARLLRAAAAGAGRAHLVSSPPGASPLARLFLASFSDSAAPTHPAAPDRLVAHLLADDATPSPPRDARPYPERLDGLGDPEDLLAAAPSPLLRPCADPEQESLLVADLVIAQLRSAPRSRITVATADRGLARRIVDQLNDAGLDLDATDGDALSAHADGRLAWQLLRAAQTGLHHEPLLELLTHPHVTCGRDRAAHARRTLAFEKEVLRGQAAGAGLAGLRRRAAERDDAHRLRRPEARPQLSELVDDLERVLAPLSALAAGAPAPLGRHVAALRAAWAEAAPDHAFDRAAAVAAPARAALAGLLDDLAAADAALPPLTAAEFTALVARQTAQIQIRPHRKLHLPVQVTGLLEARLEHADLLVLAGMNEGVFPDEPRRRTLLLGRRWRERHGLPDWRWDLGLDAELFLRLLHGGRRVAVTWSREREGRPVLPSPLVGRLLLALPQDPRAAATPAPWRRAAPDAVAIAAAQDRFRREPADRRVLAPTLPLATISHTALQTWRGCPYRFLLERGYELREEERILDELQRKDYGSIVHDALARFLKEGGEGRRSLQAGRADASRRALAAAAGEAFAVRLGDLPQRRLWEASFLALGERIVGIELDRAAAWQPRALEAGFAFTLGALRDWLAQQGAADLPDVPAQDATISVTGRLDRADVSRDGATVQVIDYKTGALPSKKSVREGEDLQLSLYALAVRLGGVAGVPADKGIVGAYYSLKPGEVDLPAEPQLGPDHDLTRDGRTVLTAALAMADRDAAYPLLPGGEDPDAQDAPCRYCAWRGACRIDEITAAATGGAS
ncbi:MAG: PD-(D/E)XK nuclease family protein [Candidatus Latescibacteria bacterium]|nr:PD-(D/E)XK nuclease family protein [Candidatus Latescibacterota bacterium]